MAGFHRQGSYIRFRGAGHSGQCSLFTSKQPSLGLVAFAWSAARIDHLSLDTMPKAARNSYSISILLKLLTR
jgi:hypothetical protein